MGAEGESLPDLEPEERGHAVGDGDLAAAFRVAASAECEQCVPVPTRVLGSELDRLEATGDGQRAVTDEIRIDLGGIASPQCERPLLYRIDPGTNRIVARLRMPDNADPR